MKAVYEFAIKPLSLNEMLASRWLKDKFKREIYAQLTEYLEVDINTKLHVVETKRKKRKFVFRRYAKPLFEIVNIAWQIHFEKSNRRDLNNFIGGLKWVQDCLVSACVLADDDTDHIKRETYKIVCPSKFTGIRVTINGKG
jgi:Holliday junction resolvase RusA-like endonuclease